MSIPPTQPAFPAKYIFYYHDIKDVMVFVEYDDGWGLHVLFPESRASYRRVVAPLPTDEDGYPNVHRAAVISGPNLEQVQCILYGSDPATVSPSFNSKKPLLSPTYNARKIECYLGPASDSGSEPVSEPATEQLAEDVSGPESMPDSSPDSPPDPPPESPWWKFWE